MGLSIGLVGLGEFGSTFADLFKRHPLVSRVALCDREPERVRTFAEREDWRDKFNPRDAYQSLDDILAARLDALVIITQPWLHAAQCIATLEAGQHVYSAVPIVTLPDGREILDWCDKLVTAVKKTGRHYMMGETSYFRPAAMYCRKQAAAGAFGAFVYAEGEYMHAFDSATCDLRKVKKQRASSVAGREWEKIKATYDARGARSGPMHYPTHSVAGPMCVMRAHAVKVTCYGTPPATTDPYFNDQSEVFSNETALFAMSNGSTMRICEFREVEGSTKDREMFRIYGTKGSYEENLWNHHTHQEKLTDEAMRDPLPEEVAAAWRNTKTQSVEYGGHGGSHAYLVHEFLSAIAADRVPAVNVWEAVRYMAAGVMAHQSALQDGERLNVPDWGDAPAS